MSAKGLDNSASCGDTSVRPHFYPHNERRHPIPGANKNMAVHPFPFISVISADTCSLFLHFYYLCRSYFQHLLFMKKALRPNERTLIALLAVFVTSVSPIYDFSEPKPFSGPDIFNPYKRAGEDSAFCWKRANFHTHTRVKGILNECEYWPAQTDEAYRKFGYDIVTF